MGPEVDAISHSIVNHYILVTINRATQGWSSTFYVYNALYVFDMQKTYVYFQNAGEFKTTEDAACSLWNYYYVDLFFDKDVQRQQVWTMLESIKNGNNTCVQK